MKNKGKKIPSIATGYGGPTPVFKNKGKAKKGGMKGNKSPCYGDGCYMQGPKTNNEKHS